MSRRRLKRCHVIEGMVQLLANGLVLQLLSIQLVWRSQRSTAEYRQVARTAATQTNQKQHERHVEAGRSRGNMEKTRRKKLGQAFTKEIECLD